MSADRREGPSTGAATPGEAAASPQGDSNEPRSLEEQLRAVERDVRELLRLHGELARLEARAGLLRLVIGFFLLGVGAFVGGFVLLAAGFALYLSLVRVLPPAGAAATVALAFALASLGTWYLAWRLLEGSGSLLLPRTRAMLGELVTWKKETPSKS